MDFCKLKKKVAKKQFIRGLVTDTVTEFHDFPVQIPQFPKADAADELACSSSPNTKYDCTRKITKGLASAWSFLNDLKVQNEAQKQFLLRGI